MHCAEIYVQRGSQAVNNFYLLPLICHLRTANVKTSDSLLLLKRLVASRTRRLFQCDVANRLRAKFSQLGLYTLVDYIDLLRLMVFSLGLVRFTMVWSIGCQAFPEFGKFSGNLFGLRFSQSTALPPRSGRKALLDPSERKKYAFKCFWAVLPHFWLF